MVFAGDRCAGTDSQGVRNLPAGATTQTAAGRLVRRPDREPRELEPNRWFPSRSQPESGQEQVSPDVVHQTTSRFSGCRFSDER